MDYAELWTLVESTIDSRMFSVYSLGALIFTVCFIAIKLLKRKNEEPRKQLKSKKKAMGKDGRNNQCLIPHTERNASGCNWEMFKSSLNSGPLNSQNYDNINKNLNQKSEGKYFSTLNMDNTASVIEEKIVNIKDKKKLMEGKVVNGKNKRRLTEGKVVNSKDKKKLTKEVAIDCEMVGIGDGSENMIARVSIVNKYGICIYDKYVKPREPVQDYRTKVSGIRPHNLQNGEKFEVVQKEVAEILKDRILVGHALKHDLDVLYLSHPRRNLRDTSRFKRFTQLSRGYTPSLKKLSQELLGKVIQTGEHSSIEDARAAMELYMLFRNIWESEFHSKR